MASARRKSSANGTWTNRKRRRLHSAPEFVICVDNSGYPVSLERNKIYRVLPDEEAARYGDLRVIDESGEDYLYSSQRFVRIAVPKAIQRQLLKAS
ncbi:MAG TPA: hypothetical protein VG204_01370 [Terriglobia bacterium]|nr:hypothetical protein [Terriglobia bacterium]